MKIIIKKKFEIMPGKFLTVTGNTIQVREAVGIRAVKGGFATSVDRPELNPEKEKKVKTDKNK